MSDNFSERDSYKRQLENHRKNLATLQVQLAGFGQFNVPAHIPLQIGDIEKEIERLESLLALPSSENRIFQVPHQRNAFFTGREDLLADLEKAQTSAITQQAVAGLGGVGKTQTAVEYAYRNKTCFELVWWVNAEFATSLRSDLANLAYALKLATPGATEQEEVIALALQHLRTCPTHWLLVLDNVEEPAHILPYLPGSGNGQTLITSRYNGDWGKSIKPLPAQIWGQSQSVQFLEKRVGRADPAFEELAQELGGLPLALEQAAAYMNAKSKSGESYLELFKKRRLELLKRGNAPEGYHNDTVATTWEISFKALGEANPAGAELLELCAWLGVAEIPFSLFLEHADKLPERLAAAAGDELDWDEAIGAIKRYSLAEVSEKGLTLHRLVGLALRTAQGTDTTRLEQAAGLLHAAYPSGDLSKKIELWEEYGQLLEAGLAAAGYAEERGVALADASYLYNQIGTYIYGARADYRQARNYFQCALAIREKSLGSEHPDVAESLNDLGMALQAMGDLPAALPLYQRALAIREKSFGSEHPDVAQSLNNLGMLLKAMGDLPAALPLLQRALAIFEKQLGEFHLSLATGFASLGSLLKAMGDLPAALPLLQRALAIFEKQLGEFHPDVATSLNNLGSLLQAMGDLPAALPLFQRALAIWEKQLGADHPNVASCCNNMGLLLQAMGEYASALPLFQRALAIWEKQLGADHPQVATGCNNMGLLLQAMGDLPAALPLLQRALAIREKQLGEFHPDVANSLNNLGALRYEMGERAEAERLFSRALEIFTKKLGSQHPSTQITKRWLAQVRGSGS
ncbi:MAG: tetratricopeptide repeat protein [Chloroflexi bacterium]|uniref:Tetratricopeptide repeat protein n=1 Tax=Candidatus Chlorohelix allophototropha TaxID=3003348 RepID=A0A8T7M9N3_9CHLR|nr:tetratricopeptide repeat protein [Chloroflexota bacterium]WJW68711.1 tetratricopeptide repeat protein [Chloroflexota bacterium L227-S17]